MPSRRMPAEIARLAIEAVRLQREEGLSTAEVLVALQHQGEKITNTRYVRFLLDRAKDLVDIRVEPVLGPPDLDEQLGRQLSRRTGIKHVVVVMYEEAKDATRAQAVRQSKELHQALGAAAANRLIQALRDNDKIAVGAGRAVSSTIKALIDAELNPRFHGLSVTSLGGGMLRAPFAPRETIELVDADYNAAQLAIALGVPVARVSLCYLPAFAPPDTCNDLIDIVAPHLRDLKADLLLYGGGVVDESHYLLRMDDPQTQVIRAQADQLKRILKRHRPAVIDFCDEFFIAPGLPEDLVGEVQGIVIALREAAIRIAPAELGRPAERILVAGGLRKIEALTLLIDADWEGPRPTTLVTDRRTAQALLARHL